MQKLLNQSCVVAFFFAIMHSLQLWGQNPNPTSEELEQHKANRLREFDRNSRLSLAEHQQLWKQNVMLFVNSSSEIMRIDAFGVAQTAFVDRSIPTLSTMIMERHSEELVNRELKYTQLSEALLNLKLLVDREWKKAGSVDFPQVIFRAELTDRFSKVRTRQETWLVIDIHQFAGSSDDLLVAEFSAKTTKDRTGRVDANDPDTQITYRRPDPRYKEATHFWSNLPELRRNRNNVLVTVVDDGLSRQEREDLLGFRVVDETGSAVHQVEGIGGRSFSELDGTKQGFMLQALSLIQERLPNGSVVSRDELHLRIGSVAKVLERRYADLSLEVTIEGNGAYSQLKIEPRPR